MKENQEKETLVVYGKGNNLIKEMRLPEFECQWGKIISQHKEDIYRHARPFYEKTTVIQNCDTKEKTKFKTIEELEELAFFEVSEVADKTNIELDKIDKQIKQLEEEKKILVENHEKIKTQHSKMEDL